MNKWKQIVDSGRKGMVFVDVKLLEREPDLIQKIFSRMLIVEARRRFIENQMVFYCFHDVFDPLDEGSCVPVYDLIIESKDSENPIWYFKRSTEPVIFI